MQVKKLGLVVTLGMIAVLMGCGGSSNNSTPPPPPTVTAITVTPATNVISTTGSATFKAEANYSDGSQADISSTATWSASPAGIVNLSGSTATGAAKGAVTITATSGSKSGSATLNVTNLSLGNGTLSGNYAFALQGIDTVGPVYTAGTITADGNGNITGGSLDSNSAANGVSSAMLTGTYSITADGRGQMTVTAVGSSSGTMFRFVISQDGTKGKVIEFDGAAAAAGTFEKQTAGALSGTYTFRLGGVELSSTAANCVGKPACYMGEIGVMTVPGSGTALTGYADANLTNGNSYATNPFAGTINAPAASRGTMSIFLRNATMVPLVYYVVSPNKLFVVSTSSTEVLGGQAETQGALSAFTGDYTFLLDHAATLTTGTFEKTGRVSLAGGAVTGGSVAEDLSSSTVQDQSFAFSSGTYTDPNATVTGQGTISALVSATSVPPNRNFVYYAVNSTKAYLLETTANCGTPTSTCSSGAFRAAIGELQGGGSVALPVVGNFIFSSVELGELSLGGQNLQVGQLISDGNGNLSGIVDAVKHAGGTDAAATTVVVSSTALDATLPAGLCSTASCPFEYGFTPTNFAALAVQNYLVYVRPDGTGGVLLGFEPDIDGYIDLQ
ncbi:MAG TPA: Ig-like domain-containing protein [Candidatus Sulfotelmatobacter sp.]|nr:Ig-like domain-containing protein [Candidatus Sulfotelmatobacter sp.]